MAQLMPLPLTVSCFSKIQIGFTFLVPAHLGSPGKGPLNGCVCVPHFVRVCLIFCIHQQSAHITYFSLHKLAFSTAILILFVFLLGFITSTIWLPTEWHNNVLDPVERDGVVGCCEAIPYHISPAYLVFIWSAYFL